MNNQPDPAPDPDEGPPWDEIPSSTPPDAEPVFGFTPAQAKRLNRPKLGAYKRIEHRDGTEWLVEYAVDAGRLISLILPGSGGTVHRILLPSDYKNYTITLGPEAM